jgi:ribosome-associated protein
MDDSTGHAGCEPIEQYSAKYPADGTDKDNRQPMEDDDQFEISKSQIKRELDELKKLGSELLEFSDDALRQLDISEVLLQALRTAKRITSNSARKRQLQYIGKLLKEENAAPLIAAVDAHKHQHATLTRDFQKLEKLRDKLIRDGDSALADVLSLFPRADRQHLRKLVRQSRNEQETKQPPRASRLLFRYLRELQEQPEY